MMMYMGCLSLTLQYRFEGGDGLVLGSLFWIFFPMFLFNLKKHTWQSLAIENLLWGESVS